MPDAPDLAAAIAAVRYISDHFADIRNCWPDIDVALDKASVNFAQRVLEALADREWLDEMVTAGASETLGSPGDYLLAALLARAGGGG